MTRLRCLQLGGALLLAFLATTGCGADPEPKLIDETRAVKEWRLHTPPPDADRTDQQRIEHHRLARHRLSTLHGSDQPGTVQVRRGRRRPGQHRHEDRDRHRADLP